MITGLDDLEVPELGVYRGLTEIHEDPLDKTTGDYERSDAKRYGPYRYCAAAPLAHDIAIGKRQVEPDCIQTVSTSESATGKQMTMDQST